MNTFLDSVQGVFAQCNAKQSSFWPMGIVFCFLKMGIVTILWFCHIALLSLTRQKATSIVAEFSSVHGSMFVYLFPSQCVSVQFCKAPCLCASVHCALFVWECALCPSKPSAPCFTLFRSLPPFFTTTHSKSINRNLPAQLSWSLKTNGVNSDWVGSGVKCLIRKQPL